MNPFSILFLHFQLYFLVLQYVRPAFADMQVHTPQAVLECTNYQILWDGGEAPYYLVLFADSNETEFVILGTNVTASPFTWHVTQPAGTSWYVRITDGTGLNQWSGTFTIQSSGTTDCSNGSNYTTLYSQTGSSPSSVPSVPSTSSHSGSRVAVIVAPIVGVGVIIVSISLAILYFRRKEKRKRTTNDIDNTESTSIDIRPLSTSPVINTVPHSNGTNYNSGIPLVGSISPLPSQDIRLPLQQRSSDASSSPLLASPRPPSITHSTILPPYQVHAINNNSGVESLPYAIPLVSGGLQDRDDEIGIFATMHRDDIPHELEEKLRRARYKPTDDPSEIPAEVWFSQYGIGHFEVKRLQELHSRIMTQERQNGMMEMPKQ